MSVKPWACFALVLASWLACAVPSASAKHPRSFRLGYVDKYFESDAGVPYFQDAGNDGAGIARIFLRWRYTAPTRPANPSDPADPAYDWSQLDRDVANAHAAGLAVLFVIDMAPDWAEGPGRPADATPGSWRPDAAALGNFATAAARHFDGSVSLWQIWNEPNLSREITPQFDGSHAAAAAVYRPMLNAAYGAIKRVDRRSVVVAAGTAPYGDVPPGLRTRPVAFWRDLLCLGPKLRRRACPDRAHFDVWAHNPYGIGGPNVHAENPDDAAIPDLGRIGRVVRAARSRRTLLPRGPKPGWVTEFSWDSNPPDPNGVPSETQAQWLAGSLYRFWLAGVTTAIWFGVRDQAPDPSYAATYQSGTHLLDGTPKPSMSAYRFPFVTGRPGAHTRLWGLAPRPGRVVVQRRIGSRWELLARVRASKGRVFVARASVAAGTVLRARQGPLTSLPWTAG